MASGPHKRRKVSSSAIQHLLHTGGISILGLSALLKKIKEADEDVASVLDATRYDMRKASAELYDQVKLEIDIHMTEGPDWRWELIDPLKLIAKAIELSLPFRTLVANAVQRSPPSAERPWRLVLGFDGFTPGDSPNVDRSSMAAFM